MFKRKKHSIPVQEKTTSWAVDDNGVDQSHLYKHRQHGRIYRFKQCCRRMAKSVRKTFSLCIKSSSREDVYKFSVQASNISTVEVCCSLECDSTTNKYNTKSPDNADLPSVRETTALIHRIDTNIPVPYVESDSNIVTNVKMFMGYRPESVREKVPAMDVLGLSVNSKRTYRMRTVIQDKNKTKNNLELDSKSGETNQKTKAFDTVEFDQSYQQDCDITMSKTVYESCADIEDDFQDGLEVSSRTSSINWPGGCLASDSDETYVKLPSNSDGGEYSVEPELNIVDTHKFESLKTVNAENNNISLDMCDDQRTVPKTSDIGNHDSSSLYNSQRSSNENMVTSTAVRYNGNPASDLQGSIQEEKTIFKCVTNVDKYVKNKQLFYSVQNSQAILYNSNRNNLNTEFQHITKSGLQCMNPLKECTLSIDVTVVNILAYPVQQHNMPLPPANIGQNQPLNQNAANRAEHRIRRQPIYGNAAQSTHQNLRVLTCSSPPFQPLDMVRAGFMGQNNTVVCRECDGRLYNFCANDDPREEHGFHFPYCPLTRDVCGDDYIGRLHLETEGTEQLRNIRVFFQTPEVQECLNKLILTDGVHAYHVAREAVENLIDRGVTEHDIEAGTLWTEVQRVKLEGNGNVYTVDVQLPYTSRPNTASEVARGNVEQNLAQRFFVEVVEEEKVTNLAAVTDEQLERRSSTFKNWPNHLQQTPDDMSIAGFSYTGQGDCVKCQECNGSLQNFCSNDDPSEEHVIICPNCPFVRRTFTPEYINSVVRSAENGLPDDNTPSWPLCIVCRANRANIMYLQCGHKICCEECSRDIKICQQCGEIVVDNQCWHK